MRDKFKDPLFLYVILSLIFFLLLLIIGGMVFSLEAKDLFSVGLWYLFLNFTGFLILPFAQCALPRSMDLGLGVSKVLSLLVVFIFNWICTSFSLLNFSSAGIFIVIIALFFSSLCYSKKIGPLRVCYKDILIVEGLFFCTFLIILLVNSFHPEIYAGEKAMDFSMLNYLKRNQSLPMTDPWASGEIMKYYYFGYYIFAGICKLLNTNPAVGYHLSIATVAGLLISSSYTLFYWVIKRRFLATLSAILLVFSSNWKAFSWFWNSSSKLDFMFFWNSSRVFRDGAFAEYPSWSLLFADLHPHVMAYPVVVTFLVFMLPFINRTCNFEEMKSPSYICFFILLWGGLIGINSWDFIILSVVFFFVNLRGLFFGRSWKVCFKVNVLLPLFLGVGTFLLFWPFISILRSNKVLVLTFAKTHRNTFINFFNHQGHWWILILLLLAPVFFISLKKRKLFFRRYFAQHFFIFSITVATIGWVAEHIVFMDRINTIFKFFNQVWLLTGIAALLLLRYVPFYFRSGKTRFAVLSKISVYLCMFLCLLQLGGTVLNIVALSRYNPFGTERPTLMGNLYFKKVNPGDYDIIQWINHNISGTPTIVEANGESFDFAVARISTHTGLPSYLGWSGHVAIRGVANSIIDQRKRDIAYIYNSTDPMKVHEFLLEKGIELVVVGALEYNRFSPRGLAKFNQYHDLFKQVKKNRYSTLYAVAKKWPLRLPER